MTLIGDKLRELRNGLSLHEVAGALGIDTSVISRYENGKRLPVPEILEKLAEYYEVEYDFLRELYYDEAITEPKEQAILLKWSAKKLGFPEEFAVLVEKLKGMDEEAQKRAVQKLITLLEKQELD